jgi:virginiamycin B lyase
VTGPDGALWFTEQGGGKIGRITTAGVITNEYPIPAGGAFPTDITVGSDGALWFTESTYKKVGRITTGGSITQYDVTLGGVTAGSLLGIASGPDGALWVADVTGNNIWRIATDGTITNRYPVPTANSYPYEITSGPDGALCPTLTTSPSLRA